MKVKTIFVGATLFILFLSGCDSSSSPDYTVMQGKFSSMDHCISTIEKHTNLKIRPLTDKPDHVSGYLGTTDRDFNCEIKETGTEGTYVEGWFEE